jgi:hypothetical protein
MSVTITFAKIEMNAPIDLAIFVKP